MDVAVFDPNFVVTVVNEEDVCEEDMRRKASVGSRFVDVFEKDDRQAVIDALARAEDGGMEQLDRVGVLGLAGIRPERLSPKCSLEYKRGLPRRRRSEAEEPNKDFSTKAPVGPRWLSSNGKVLWANNRQLEVMGYSREEYIGSDIMDFRADSEDDVVEIFSSLAQATRSATCPSGFAQRPGKRRTC